MLFGTVSPFSRRDSACRVTKIFSASSSCDRPFFVLSSYNTSFVFIKSLLCTHSNTQHSDNHAAIIKQPIVAGKKNLRLHITYSRYPGYLRKKSKQRKNSKSFLFSRTAIDRANITNRIIFFDISNKEDRIILLKKLWKTRKTRHF